MQYKYASIIIINAVERLWKRYRVFSHGFMVICDVRLPRSDRNSVASMLMDPPFSIAIGTKWCVLLRQEYLFILFAAVWWLYQGRSHSYSRLWPRREQCQGIPWALPSDTLVVRPWRVVGGTPTSPGFLDSMIHVWRAIGEDSGLDFWRARSRNQKGSIEGRQVGVTNCLDNLSDKVFVGA